MSWRAVTFDPKTRRIIHGRVLQDGARLELHLPRFLKSPNAWLWSNWQAKKREKDVWARLIRLTIAHHINRPSISAFDSPARAIGWTAPARAVLQVVRVVKFPHHRMTDDDNLRFAAKGLTDCLVQAGFLVDDNRDVLRVPIPEQRLSTDKLAWTHLIIEPDQE